MSGGINKRNDEAVNMWAADFRRLYSPTHAFADAVAMFLTLPGLVGFWPGSAMGAAGLLNDLSGNGLQMTNNNNADFSATTTALYPWLEFDGSNQYFSRADTGILDIAGNEAYVAAAIQGLTLGGWFWVDALGSAMGLMTKFLTPGQKSYYLIKTSSNRLEVHVSADGANSSGVNNLDELFVANTWNFCVGRWTPGTEINAMVNNVQSATGGLAGPLFNSTTAFEIGRHEAGNYLNGRASLCFLCAAAVPDAHLTTLYEMSRPLFGR